VTVAKWKVGVVGGFCLALARPAMAQEDPGAMGPLAVSVSEYGSWTTSVSLGQIATIEVLGQVHYPTSLSQAYPLVVLLHGRHHSCHNLSGGGGAYVWPCNPTTQAPNPSYQGYDYVARVLASHGMIVASISANGINAVDNGLSGYGMTERGLLVQYHLDLWRTFNTTGGSPFGSRFVGHVDLSRVGTMGHSRGGEGVIFNYERNQALGAPYGIRAVLPLAPVDVFGHFVNRVPMGVLLPYCDGDVFLLEGVGYFDDARYAIAGDDTPKYTFLALGANHNFFNRIWTPDQYAYDNEDDWVRWIDPTDPFCGPTVPGNGRLTSAQQRGVGTAYMAAFFRKHLLGSTAFDGILNGDSPPPPSAQTNAIYDGYFPGESDRKDLNRLTSDSELTVNTLGGNVTTAGMAHYALCGDWTDVHCVDLREPHFPSLSSVELGWGSSGARYSNQLPDGRRDVSNFATLQFRTALDYSDSRNPEDQSQDLSIQLIDGAGRTATVRASDYLDVLFFPPAYPVFKAAVMNTARIPMKAFVGVDLTNIASVDLVFDQEPTGGILVSDMAFAGEGISAAEIWLASTAFLN
jgi:hypothetical protein